MDNADERQRQDSAEPARRPWIGLNTSYDVEAWIDNYNRDLRRALEGKKILPDSGYGICFYLEAGGEIYLHTTPDGDILLDVTPDAQWVAPVITAATGVATPSAQLWALPGDVLTQLVLGLTSLISATQIVLRHDFRIRKY